MAKKRAFKPHSVQLKKFGNVGFAFIIPQSGMTQKQREETFNTFLEIQVEEPTDLSKKDFRATMAYVRRALSAYKKQGGR